MEISLYWQQCIRAGIYATKENAFSEAQNALSKALIEAERMESPICVAFSCRLLGALYLRMNDLQNAEAKYRRAFTVCLGLGNEKGLAESLAGLASVKSRQRQFEQAQQLYSYAANIFPQDVSPLREAALYTELAHVCFRCMDWDSAQTALRKAAKIYRKHECLAGEAEILFLYAEIMFTRSRKKLAMKYFRKAGALFLQIGDFQALAAIHHIVAFAFVESAVWSDALMYEDRTVVLLKDGLGVPEGVEETSIKVTLREACFLQGYVCWQAGYLEEAEARFLEAVAPANATDQFDEFDQKACVFQSLALASLQRQNFSSAKEYYLQAMKWFQHAENGPKIGEIAEELAFLITNEKALEKINSTTLTDEARWKLLLKSAHNLERDNQPLKAVQFAWQVLKILREEGDDKDSVRAVEEFVRSLSQKIRG
ncbi:MAG: tetratricopeptide repeat protein [Peptococcaceae bacterium]|nr:tetratricopeptide repeat protein [Peptococcaceae bacterium]